MNRLAPFNRWLVLCLLSSSVLAASPDGVVVDEYLRNPDYPNVFALGACVAQPPVEVTPGPVGAPDSVYSISKACARGSTANRAEQAF